MKLNELQQALIAHLSQKELQNLLDTHKRQLGETRVLLAENAMLKDRIELLEKEIATHAFGGWQIH